MLVGLIVCLILASAFYFIIRRLIAPDRTLPVSVDWIHNLSVNRYRPMERLLANEDFAFLATQPGYNRKLARKLRADRRKIFRGYLRCLEKDFSRICAALDLLVVESPQDRPDLAAIVWKQRAIFAVGMLGIHVRLALHACGIGSVDVRNLVGAFDRMGSELQRLIPATDSAMAA